MQPARLDLRVNKGATFRALLRVMQPSLIYKAITAIAATAPVRLTVAHELPTDWPVWVEQAQQLQALNRAPLRTTPHMASVIDANTLEINTINAAGTSAKGGQLIYQAPLELTGATAVLQLLEEGADAGTLPVTVNAGGWVDVDLTAAETAALGWAARDYVLDVTMPGGEVIRAYAGAFTVEVAGANAGKVCQGFAVLAGDRGPAGPTITGAAIDEDGHLIITLEDGTEIDAGVIDRPWGTIQGDITQQLDLMQRLDLKVDKDTYDAFALAVNNALADRYTKSESDGRYDASGAASAAVTAHEALPDPHPQYTTAPEASAAAPVQSVQGRAGAVVITAGDLSLEEVDNTSDADKPLSDAAVAALSLKLNASLKGADNGLAELDNDGKVPLSQISDAVLGQLSYEGLWSAGTNTPTLPATPAKKGDYYIANAAGTQFGLEFDVGDWLVSDGAAWGKVDNTDAVASVNGKKGVVTITKADVGLGSVDNTSDAAKPVSTAQQTALNLKADKTDARFTDAREWTATEVSQPEAETGAATTARKWTSLRVRQSTAAWWAGLGTAFGRGFIGLVDAAAARLKLGLGTFATANYSAAPFINVMPDSGRFAGRANPLSYSSPATFVASPFLASYNGAVTASAGKYIYDNSTSGGAAGALTASVQVLLTALGKVGAGATRYGVEFYISEITAGAGLAAGTVVGTDGVPRYLCAVTGSKALFAADSYATFVFWIRAKSGSVCIRRASYHNAIGVAEGTPIFNTFTHVRVVYSSAPGYDFSAPYIYAEPGSVIEVALMGVFPGIVDVGIHKAPLPTINELNA